MDLTTVIGRLDQKLQSFKSRKMLDKSKAITGHYGLKSQIQELNHTKTIDAQRGVNGGLRSMM